MRKFTFQRRNSNKQVTAGMRRVHFPKSTYKQLGYLAAIMLVVVSAPFVVRAMSQDSMTKDSLQQDEIISGQQINQSQPKSEERSRAIRGEQSMNSSININTQTNNSKPDGSDVDVTINGRNVPVPKDGMVHKSISGNNGKTTIDISVDGDSSSQSSSSSTVIIEQHSYSSGDITQDKGGIGRHPSRR